MTSKVKIVSITQSLIDVEPEVALQIRGILIEYFPITSRALVF